MHKKLTGKSDISSYLLSLVDSVEIDGDKIKINTTKEITINNKDSMIILNKGIQLCGGVDERSMQQDRQINKKSIPKKLQNHITFGMIT
jgi:hypothetical protein